MRQQYIQTLEKLTSEDARVYALISDNGAMVYDNYKKQFPNNLINIGIAEANMVSIAAGLAACGKIPFTYTIASFLTMRAFEQIRNDVCLQKMNVKLVGVGSGFNYSYLGPTHHALEDIALMRTLPGMTIFSPGDKQEVASVTKAAKEIVGPVYIRLATVPVEDIYTKDYYFVPGKAVILEEGNDIALISTGIMLQETLKLAQLLKQKKLSVNVINIHTIKPLDEEKIIEVAERCKLLATIEDHSLSGGLGEAVAGVIAKNLQKHAHVKCFGLDNTFGQEYGTLEYLQIAYKLNVQYMLEEIMSTLDEY